MKDITMTHLNVIPHIIDGTLILFRYPIAQNEKYTINNPAGNAYYEHLDDDHYTVQHKLRSGGRVVIDVKYEPNWKDEDIT